jgi:hypothetical protein
MNRSLAALATFAVSAVPALAHVGHVLDEGHGHVHWDELLIVAGLVAVLIGYGLARLYRRYSKA